jgi:hypothetical protein
MNWGKKIAILYMGFVALIVTMVCLSMREKIDLESPDYYEQELKFQDKIDKMNRAEQLKESLNWQIVNSNLVISFPGELSAQKPSAVIHLVRPSDAALDKNFELKPDTLANRLISLTGLKQGAYKIQVDWKAGEITYYNEGVITLN